ncbi:RNA-directed DNA polymerase [Fulvivirga sp. M361]|uniref:antiviral reverse transcriptase Drt3b n=1 Tax=Fulvivirga sp. M361 TaxID=2594266 RepID=UPI00117B4EA3|nr:antiviral reverse transcriptase Drt3b [Fulvivirga sp. M361]TRX45357.1 RNA-directed DNA polymerase [Fulvivirga sp. M361]
MSKVKINKDDRNRVLLTELLPYEVPMLFSNDGLYSIITSGKFERFEKKIKSLKNSGAYGIPFNFEVRKSVLGDTRILSVIHPLSQLAFIDFYSKYDAVLLHLCSKSPFSLRKPANIAKYCYTPDMVFEEDEHKNQEVEVIPDILDKETRLLKSYFTYEPIDLIYKFYERNEYQRLEQRFNLLLEFDISKCFYNIYTHSVTWAVKDKESAKRNSRKESFENTFDKIMQLANYNETNGIVVGPEVSRIFAEVILQQIDLNVLSVLKKEGLKHGVDFEIRRYVDDFFVFSNDEEYLNLIQKTYKKELEEYKLYTNESKTDKKTTPFITNIAVGKRELKHLLDTLFNSLVTTEESNTTNDEVEKIRKIEKIRSPYALSKNFIKDFQCKVQRNNLTYDVLSTDIVRYIKQKIVKLFKDKDLEKPKDVIENYLLLALDISFYAYSLNITSSATFKLAQMIVLICKFLDSKDEDLRQNIFSKIFREADFVMTIFQRKSKKNETNIETLNLLIALKKLDDAYILSEKKIRELFNLNKKSDYKRINYFHIITLLYYFGDNSEFNKMRNEISEQIITKFENEFDPFTKSELTLLFFDTINCPFVGLDTKKKLMRTSKYAKGGKEEDEIKEIMKQKTWFMDWDTEIDLERVLKKKEWGSSY